MKKNKKIQTAVLAATTAGVLGVAVVAQQCAAAVETPEQALINDENIIRDALINLSNTTTIPDENTIEGGLLEKILEQVQLIDDATSSIVSINIINPITSITINNFQNSVVIAENAMTIEVEGGVYSTYTNTARLIFTDILISNENALISVTLSLNSLEQQISSSELLRDVFLNLVTNLNGTTAPSNQNQLVLYNILLNQVQQIFPDGNATVITSINIGTGSIEDIRQRIIVNEEATTITIGLNFFTLTTNGVSVSNFENRSADLVIRNITVINSEVINVNNQGTVGGLEPLYDAREVIVGTLTLLEQITAVPPEGSNIRVFYDTFLAGLQMVDGSIDQITNFSIINIGQITITTDNSQINIPANSLSFATTGGEYTNYSNTEGTVIVNGISINEQNGSVSSIPVFDNATIVIAAQPTNSEILIRETNRLSDFTSVPSDIPENASVRFLWLSLQNFLQISDNQGGGPNTNLLIANIVFMNPATTDIISVTNGNFLSVEQNSMFITTTGGLASNNWTNLLQEATFSGLVVSDGVVDGLETISGIAAELLPEETIKMFGENLNGVSEIPLNSSLNVLYNAILMRLRTLYEVEYGVTEIDTIQIIDPSNNVIATATSLTFLQGSLSVTTNSSEIALYRNTDNDFTLSVELAENEDVISSASSSSNIMPQPTDEETITNAILGLASLSNISSSNPPSDNNQLIIYNQLLTALSAANSNIPVTTIQSISINNPSDSLVINPTATRATIFANSITIETNNGTDDVTFVNENVTFNIPDIVVSNGVISSVGTITGIVAAPEDVALIAIRLLNGVSSRPSNINAGLIWDAILADIQTSIPIYEVTNLGSMTISNATNNIAFQNNRIEIVATAMRITDYASYLVPGRIANQSLLTIDFDVNNGILNNVVADGNWNVALTSDQAYYESLWVQIVNTTDFSTLSADALLLLNAIEARVIEQFVGSDSSAEFINRQNVVATTERPLFGEQGITLFPTTFNYTSFIATSSVPAPGREVNITILAGSNPVIIAITRSGNGRINTIDVTGNFTIAML